MVQSPVNKTPVVELKSPPHTSLAAHYRQSVWQIYVPLGVTMVVILALLAGVIITAASPDTTTLSRWADTSFIFLSAPVIVGCFFILVFAFALVYLLARLLRLVPSYTLLAQAYAVYAYSLVRQWCDQIASPVISLRGYLAGFQAALAKAQKGI